MKSDYCLLTIVRENQNGEIVDRLSGANADRLREMIQNLAE